MGCHLALQSSGAFHLGVDNLGVVRHVGRLLDGHHGSVLFELVKDGDLLLLLERMLHPGRDQERINVDVPLDQTACCLLLLSEDRVACCLPTWCAVFFCSWYGVGGRKLFFELLGLLLGALCILGGWLC